MTTNNPSPHSGPAGATNPRAGLVRIVTDSSSCLPPQVAQQLDITVLPVHHMEDGDTQTTAGLSALELTAAYARQLERGGDAGVVALHLSKEISSTWAAAITAAGVFPEGQVKVIDTQQAGMAVGAAAMAAARLAADGANLQQCTDIAQDTLSRAHTWLYVHSTDHLRRSGRISAASALLSTAFAIKPIMHLAGGKLELAAKTRTQVKAWTKLLELAITHAGGQPAFVAVQHADAAESAEHLAQLLREQLPAGSSISVMPLSPIIAVHAGPGAVAISCIAHIGAS